MRHAHGHRGYAYSPSQDVRQKGPPLSYDATEQGVHTPWQRGVPVHIHRCRWVWMALTRRKMNDNRVQVWPFFPLILHLSCQLWQEKKKDFQCWKCSCLTKDRSVKHWYFVKGVQKGRSIKTLLCSRDLEIVMSYFMKYEDVFEKEFKWNISKLRVNMMSSLCAHLGQDESITCFYVCKCARERERDRQINNSKY